MSGLFFIERLFGPEWQVALMQVFIVVFSVCCHEYAHARIALWQGDPTAADEGHLTLNPLKQMGVMSLLMLALIGISWGQVPVRPELMRKKCSEALVAFAGPAMNLLLFFAFAMLASIARLKGWSETADLFFVLGAIINIVLFLFNMVPAPPLDGWNVFNYFFPKVFSFHSEVGKGLTIFVFLGAIVFFNYFYAAGLWTLRTFNQLFVHFVVGVGLVLTMTATAQVWTVSDVNSALRGFDRKQFNADLGAGRKSVPSAFSVRGMSTWC